MDLLRQSGETLAGRIAYLELGPFDALEVGASDLDTLWVRGGFPDSYLASDDDRSLAWRENSSAPTSNETSPSSARVSPPRPSDASG